LFQSPWQLRFPRKDLVKHMVEIKRMLTTKDGNIPGQVML